ncbi:MAG: plasmid maintenance system killer [Denitrovibrio sp.]|nr:MAG: plasmid maintenance system killer [Denitrovibrio sp.]
MIKSFKDKETKQLFLTGKSRKFSPSIIERAKKLLGRIDKTDDVESLYMPPSNRLHKLSGDLDGFWSVSINNQFRIIFRWADGNAEDVGVVDYH